MSYAQCLICKKRHNCSKEPTQTCLDPDTEELHARVATRGLCPGYGEHHGRCHHKVKHGEFYCESCLKLAREEHS